MYEPLPPSQGHARGTVAGDKSPPPFGFPGLLVAVSFLFMERPWSRGTDLTPSLSSPELMRGHPACGTGWRSLTLPSGTLILGRPYTHVLVA